MLRFFKRRGVLIVLGFLLLALFIWFAGPLFAFAEWYPLASMVTRIALIILIVALWAGVQLWKRWRAARKGEALLSAVATQPSSARTTADSEKMRTSFAEAVDLLKKTNKGRSHGIYDLPWYVIVGPPGSGKTTVLANSGLHMPLAQRLGREGVRGVGGTRNCDWFFTEEAVLLDTAGRFLTQDSDPDSDASDWKEFLALLKKYRGRRPLNGVILTVSAHDLLTHSVADRERDIRAARNRLEELYRESRLQLPVYVLVTKCDLIAGFGEYFDDLDGEGRAQVWGVTFPYEQTRSGRATENYPEQFDRLIERLNARVFARIEAETDPGRRGKIFAFPQQTAALRELLSQYVADVFATTRFESQLLLRGVYFTSGTQEGTPIDRLVSAVGRIFGVAPEAAPTPASGRGKAFFIGRLLREVLFAESGIAGVDRRGELIKAAALLGAYAAVGLLTILWVAGTLVSFGRNRGYLSNVAAQFAQVASVTPVWDADSLENALPRLDAVRHVYEVANEYQGDAPWLMRFGLFQGHAVTNSARDAYLRELNTILLPRLMQRMRQRLIDSTTEPDRLYEYLKAYLMLGQPRHVNTKQLGAIADLEWELAYPSQLDLRQDVGRHFHFLLTNSDALRALPMDDTLVSQARAALANTSASLATLMYSRLKLNYADDGRALRLDTLGADRVFRRKGGASLTTPVPALYTSKVFPEATTAGTAVVVKQFAEESWVLGSASPSLRQTAQMSADVISLYEKDYGDRWEQVLSDIELVACATVDCIATQLGILGADTSPLRKLLDTVDKNTHLVPNPGEAPPSSANAVQKAVMDPLRKLLHADQTSSGANSTPPGSQVTARFSALHKTLTPAGNAPIDDILKTIRSLQQTMMSTGAQADQGDPLAALSQSGPGRTLRAQAALLPPSVTVLVQQVVGRSEGVTVNAARNQLDGSFQQYVVRPCTDVVQSRYPFAAHSSSEVPPADFGRLFGYGGVFDTFFRQNLARLVDTSQSPWKWRLSDNGVPVASNDMLRIFQAAEEIRQQFFAAGSPTPALTFTIQPTGLDGAADRFVLELGGQSYEYRHGPDQFLGNPAAPRWPGSNPEVAAISLYGHTGDHQSISAPAGYWALFRLLDRPEVQISSIDGVRYLLSFQVGDHDAQVTLGASSIHNPFGRHDLQNFRCSP